MKDTGRHISYPKPEKIVKVKKRLNKVKKTSRGALTRKADKLFSLKIRAIGFCQLKGLDNIKCAGTLQCMHIIGRANRRLRWSDWNAVCGCAGHHVYYTNHPWEWQELVKANWKETYEYLNEHRQDVWDKDIEKVLLDLAPSK